MSVVGSRVGIVGGSVAGCAMAVAAGRLGCEVAVFEASSGVLEDRGAGIFIPLPLREQLTVRGYLPVDTPYCYPSERSVTVFPGRRTTGASSGDRSEALSRTGCTTRPGRSGRVRTTVNG